MIDYTANQNGASVSNCQRYRYTLTRKLLGTNPPLVFCMLNPSTADALADDPTIRRCVGFAQREYACGIIVVNLFAARETNPAALANLTDPVGPENDTVLRRVATGEGKSIICAWGGDKLAQYRAGPVTEIFRAAGARLLCLGNNKDGSPKHPLYLAGNTPLIVYTGDQTCGTGKGRKV